MQLNSQQSVFLTEEKKVSAHRDFWDWIYLHSDIFILSEKFVEYQKDLFSEFLWNLTEKLWSDEDIDLEPFKKYFELSLQDLNSKLSVFAEKIKDVNNFDIRWVVQIFFWSFYIASMIWDVSTVVIKWTKVNYVVDNSLDWWEKIDLFSELIEWELEHGDKIMFSWMNVLEVFDKEDIEEALKLSASESRDVLEVMKDISNTRVDLEQIVMLWLYEFQNEIILNKDSVKDKIYKNLEIAKYIKDSLVKFRYPLTISAAVIMILFLFYSFVSNFVGSDVGNVDGNTVVIDFTIEDLKKDIDIFRKMDASSDEKYKKYEDISNKLGLLEQKNKWTYDVKELKNVLNTEYYKWFNIALFNDLAWSQVYKFDDNEVSWLGDIKSVSYSNGFTVAWSKWAIFSALSDKIRWKLISYNLPEEIVSCSPNILMDWSYCFSNAWSIFNMTKAWVQSVSTKSWKFSSNISWISAFKKSNFYVFPNTDSNSNEITLTTRFNNIVGSQVKFSEWVNYIIDKSFLEKNKEAIISWFSWISVDGTFLAWSKSTKKLYQFWRDSNTWYLLWRKVDMVWWEKVGTWYSDNVKIIAEVSWKYVFILDRTNKNFTVYSSAPYKTNDAYYNSYKLMYLFRINFDTLNVEVKDVYVEWWEKKSMYFVTNEWIHKIKLYEFEESFKKKN